MHSSIGQKMAYYYNYYYYYYYCCCCCYYYCYCYCYQCGSRIFLKELVFFFLKAPKTRQIQPLQQLLQRNFFVSEGGRGVRPHPTNSPGSAPGYCYCCCCCCCYYYSLFQSTAGRMLATPPCSYCRHLDGHLPAGQ